jgi:diguanylate cyclase (GGDEF)-like protein
MSNTQPPQLNQYDPQELLNCQPVIVTVIDPASYKSVFQNQVSLAKFGDISNQTCHEKIAACSTPCAFCKMPEAVKTGQITASEVPLPNDEYLLVQWSKAHTVDGRVHVVETITDITQVKRQQHRTEVLNRQLEVANGELVTLNQQLQDRSVRDGLTGLYNHSHFRDVLHQMGAQAMRSGAPLSLLFLDLDQFKVINDSYGHETGDEVLRQMGHLLDGRQASERDPRLWRTSDVAARYGGDEFAVLLPDTTVEGAVALAERLRQQVNALTRLPELANLASASFPLSCSLGVATFPTHAGLNGLVLAADSALYAAKNSGKNSVKLFLQESTALSAASCAVMSSAPEPQVRS